ncbi:MAG: EAL domain-containing protein [Gammaproteobacteria bacterium]|nr:EAL domain-containing protein [Gammaproteobacteria bacterium]
MKHRLMKTMKSLTTQLWYFGLALLLLTLWMSSMTLHSLRTQLMDSIVDQANVVADNIAPALQFEDSQHSDAVLASLAGNRAIVGAMLLDNQYQIKALWTREVDLTQWLTSDQLLIPEAFTDHVVVYPIEIDRSIQGQLVVLTTHHFLYQRVMTNLLVTLTAIALVLLLAYFLLRRADLALMEKEEALYHQANFDSLTGLANRNMMLPQIAKRMDQQQPFQLLFVDIDHFKQVNDGHGHAVGDALLRVMVQRWQQLLPKATQVFRQGNDEFIIVVDASCSMNVAEIAKLLIHHHKMALSVNHHDFFLTLTMGSCRYPEDATELNELLRHLDIALHVGKVSRRGKLTLFSAEMLVDNVQRLQRLTELQHAIERNELVLYYQPQIDLASQRVVGVEALIRWQHHSGSLVPPNEFIPIAEESGLIVPIGSWVLREACRVRRIWLDQGIDRLVMAVNLSARQFQEEDLPTMVHELLTEFSLPPQLLSLEVTESLLMSNLSKVVLDLNSIRALGVGIAIDDFGTGYSSMSYLQQLPIDTLKIDRSFVQHLHSNNKDKALVKTMAQLAHNLGMNVVAEGIELQEQADFLRSIGCEKAQGYFYGRPMSASALIEKLSKTTQENT